MCVGVDVHPEYRIQSVELDYIWTITNMAFFFFKFQKLIMTSRYGRVGDLLMMSPLSCF